MAAIGQDILFARKILEKGELVAVPTETVYGLAANALNAKAVTKIFVTKNRPTFDPLIIHIASEAQLENFVTSVPDDAKKLIKHFWPGPLTLVLPRNKNIPDIVTAGLSTVGVRCPDHYLTQQLLALINFPLAAPSANPFGYVSPTTAEHVNAQLGEQISYILDGGPCRVGIESTIIGFENNKPIIYRRGGIPEEAIERIVGPVQSKLHSSSNPAAPGQLVSHYAPKINFLLGDIDALIDAHKDKKIGLLRFKKIEGESSRHEICLSAEGDMAEAAQNLFAALRKLDQMDVDIIIAEKVPDIGIGKAINDRLIRAAAK